MKTKRLDGAANFVSCVKALKVVELCRGYGKELFQVQYIDLTHVWLCSLKENCLGTVCVKIKIKKVEKAVKQFEDGELGVLVIEVQKPSEKIPEIEQTYSAGAVCLSLVNAGLAAGWGANWLTGWLSHDKKFVAETFGLKTNERVAGIIYFGTETVAPSERPRPNLSEIVTWD